MRPKIEVPADQPNASSGEERSRVGPGSSERREAKMVLRDIDGLYGRARRISRRIYRRVFGPAPTWGELEDRLVSQRSPNAIPNQVFQTAPSRLIDSEHLKEILRFRHINEDLSFVFFDDTAMAAYMAEHWAQHPIHSIFQRALFPQIQTDIFRYCLLHDQGGYWMDINKAVFTQLSSLHSTYDTGLIAFERNDCPIFPGVQAAKALRHPEKFIIQWGFGFSPKHEVLSSAIDQIVSSAPFFEERICRHVKEAVFSFTGPGLFTSTVRSHLELKGQDNLSQSGIDWDGQGWFRVKGSHRSPKAANHYRSAKYQKILKAEI